MKLYFLTDDLEADEGFLDNSRHGLLIGLSDACLIESLNLPPVS